MTGRITVGKRRQMGEQVAVGHETSHEAEVDEVFSFLVFAIGTNHRTTDTEGMDRVLREDAAVESGKPLKRKTESLSVGFHGLPSRHIFVEIENVNRIECGMCRDTIEDTEKDHETDHYNRENRGRTEFQPDLHSYNWIRYSLRDHAEATGGLCGTRGN